MKKTLLLFAMLLGVVGAWAEVESLKVSTDAKKYYYVIKSLRTGKYAYYNGDGGQLLQQVNPTSATEQGTLNKYLWYVTEAKEAGEGAYMLHNVATTKVYETYKSFTDAGAVVYIKENPYRSGYVCVSSSADATTKNSCWDDQGNQTKIGPYETRQNDNEGTSWSFIEIDPNATVAYTLSDNAGNSYNGTFTGWSREMYPVVTGVAGYTLSNIVYGDKNVTATINFPFSVSKVDGTTNWTIVRSKPMSDGAAYIYVNGEGKIVSKSTIAANGVYGYLPTSTEGEVKKWMWAIYPQLTKGNFTFQIKNAATDLYVPTATGQNLNIFVSETAGNFSWGTCTGGSNGFYLDEYKNLFWGAASSKVGEQAALIWNKPASTSHQGCNLEFINPIYSANCTLNDNSGNTYTCKAIFGYTVEEGDVERPQITGVPSTLLADDQWKDGAYTATLNLPFAVTNGEKVTPIFINTYGEQLFKWQATGTGIKAVKNVSATSSNVAAHLWEIIPYFDNGAFTFNIKNFATGTYVFSASNENSHAEGKVTLSETPSAVTYESNGFKLSTGKFLSINSSSGNTGTEQILGTWGSHNGTSLNFPIAEFTVTIGETGYATLYSPITVIQEPEEKQLEIYQIKSAAKNGRIELTQMYHVYKNQGVILKGESGTYRFALTDDYYKDVIEESMWDNNKLKGSFTNTYVEGGAYGAYVLANGTNGVGLYKAELNKNANGESGNTHFKNNAGKAYLPASALSAEAAESRFFLFGFGDGEETGITETENGNVKTENTVVYDLAGRRVQGAQKGIFIVNGKKVVR